MASGRNAKTALKHDLHLGKHSRIHGHATFKARIRNEADLPGPRVHPLNGRRDYWSVHTYGNWHLVLHFLESHAWDVDSVEYRKKYSMCNPPHPGEVIREGCLIDGLTVETAAKCLGVSRTAFKRVLDGQAPISPHLARQMETVGWSTAPFWLRMQAGYDRAQERLRH